MLTCQGVTIPRSLEEVISLQNTALIVYDMQAGITRQLNLGAQITSEVGKVLEAAGGAGLRIFFTRHMSLPRNLMGAFQYRTAMAWQRTDSPEKHSAYVLAGQPGI
jgi:nicotinamidase-related amidase